MVQFVARFLLASSVLLGFAAAGPIELGSEDLAIRELSHLLGRGSQFITGPCKKDSDCAAGCCGFNTGKCAGPIIALQRDGGCGFGAKPNDNAARKLGFTGGITSASTGPGGKAKAGANTKAKAGADTKAKANTNTKAKGGSGKAPGTQFITGPCAKDSECASGCCGFRTGKCAGAIIALQRDGGCGRGNAKANDNAAQKLGFKGGITSRASGDKKSGNFHVANAEKAKAENNKSKTLNADSACKDGQNACIGKSFAVCANGKFVQMPCNTGLVCKSLPLVNKAGTSFTCTTEADADARIQASLEA